MIIGGGIGESYITLVLNQRPGRTIDTTFEFYGDETEKQKADWVHSKQAEMIDSLSPFWIRIEKNKTNNSLKKNNLESHSKIFPFRPAVFLFHMEKQFSK